ncbi:hypothetical protein EXS74_01920 [Candidatus Woesearchaeota archaeon]|nr:hypothetical protein [Candidatus Woesearchaeota archaeon]
MFQDVLLLHLIVLGDRHRFQITLELKEFFTKCDAGTIPASDCVLTMDNPYFSSYLSEVKEAWKAQMSPLFRLLDPYMEKIFLFSILGVFSFLLGVFFLFFSLNYDRSLFFRKLSGKLAFHFLFAFLLVFFFLHLQKQDLLSLFQWAIEGAPVVLQSFATTFLLVFIRSLFQVFFYPLMILSIFFLGIWVSLWIYSLFVAKKKKKHLR